MGKKTEQEKPVKQEKPSEQDKPTEEKKSTEEDKPTEKDKPAGQDKPTEEEKATEQDKPTEKDKPAGKDKPTEEEKAAEQAIKDPFDQTFSEHIERLLGMSSGIEGLPLNFVTVPSLILLAERETEIESFPYLPPPRFTNETLIEELTLNSLMPGEDENMAIQEMEQKGYIEVADDGRFFAQKPTLSMARLFDLVLPNMPGMNLIAFLGQMIDEVQMERKDLPTAVDQFDQLLELQGIPLEQVKAQMESDRAAKRSTKKEIPPQEMVSFWKEEQPLTRTGQSKPADIFSHLKTETWSPAPPVSPPEPEVRSSHVDPEQLEVKGDEIEDLLPEEDESIESPAEMVQETEAQEQVPPEEPKDEGPAEEIKSVLAEKSLLTEDIKDESDIGPVKEAIDRADDVSDISDDASDISDEALDMSDEAIERRIAAFEKDLGMACPLCRAGEIKTQETAKGKVFYRCSENNCTFISWGKPYYLVCPQCNNPFLIEVSDRTGKIILKCPKATCHYWQKLPWEMTEEPEEKAISASQGPAKPAAISKKPRRRVVRRRVVRRKR